MSARELKEAVIMYEQWMYNRFDLIMSRKLFGEERGEAIWEEYIRYGCDAAKLYCNLSPEDQDIIALEIIEKYRG